MTRLSTPVRVMLIIGTLVYLTVIYSLNTRLFDADRTIQRIREQAAAEAQVAVEEVTLTEAQQERLESEEQTREQARFAILVINCALLWGLLYFVLWPFLRRALDDGIYQVCESTRLAETRRTDAEAQLEAAREKLQGIDREVEALREREARAGAAEAERMKELARSDARQVVEHAESGVVRELELAQDAVVRRIAVLAVDRAFEEAGTEVDEATRTRIDRQLVEGFCQG